MPTNCHAVSLRPTTLALCLVLAAGLAATDSQAATKKRKSAATAKPAAPTVTACGDFYGFANADWVKSHPVPASGSVSALGELAQRAQQQQRELLEAAVTSARTPAQKFLGDFWASGMDESAVDRDGNNAIAPLLAKIDAIKKNKDVPGVIAALHQAGLPVTFEFGAAENVKAPGTGIGLFREGGLGLPDPAFYTRNDADARAVLGRYNGYVQKLLALSGTPQARVAADAQQVIDLETRIARASKSASAQAQNIVATKELPKRFRNLALDSFLKAQGVSATEVAFTDTALFGQLDKLVGGQKPGQWQAYLRYQVASAMAPYLGKAWRDAEHDFRGKLLRGEDTPPPRWQQVLAGIDAAAGEMVSDQYQSVFFPDATRTRASAISQQMKSALLSAIDTNTWMDATGKAAARARVEPLQIELGGPARTYDFSLPASSRSSFAANALIAAAWSHREDMKRIGRSDIGRAWDVMPQSPALYYDAAQNRLFATAAALQPPVLDMSQNLASQYGSFGAMLGHEMTHAIDDSGGATNAAWTARTTPLAAHYNSFGYPHTPSVKVNGARTRNENAADLSGLELAYMAHQTAEPQANAAAQQNFFRGWSRVWTQQLATGTASAHAATSMQPPGMWRSNGTLMLMPAFAKAYACKAGSMMIAPEGNQFTLWK